MGPYIYTDTAAIEARHRPLARSDVQPRTLRRLRHAFAPTALLVPVVALLVAAVMIIMLLIMIGLVIFLPVLFVRVFVVVLPFLVFQS